ncbi:hypothetical protein ACP8ZW_02300 [Escherichia coli]|uniref:hypothetical protein n=1 Tax=Pseudescherichia sp. TaxID=2055881 RepID=UPI0028AD0497|nr:hypothetical protein [Pseudescherichia sp.]
MRRRYHHPLERGFSEKIHTPSGVMSLIEKSHLMELLRELEKDGHNVAGASAELAALLNYASCTQMTLTEIQTHLDYCTLHLKKNIG